MTSSPSNEAELQLYRVMQRASLLAYYDTLLEMGKDIKVRYWVIQNIGINIVLTLINN